MAARALHVFPQHEHRLRSVSRPVQEFSDALRCLIQEMIDTMYAHEGIGLAAPQIGEPLQLFVVNPSQERGREVVVVNPRVELARGRASTTEGCLSLPGVWERVVRAASIRLRGADPFGRPVELEADGLLAIAVQHEVDHLHGTLLIDRLPWSRRPFDAPRRKAGLAQSRPERTK